MLNLISYLNVSLNVFMQISKNLCVAFNLKRQFLNNDA